MSQAVADRSGELRQPRPGEPIAVEGHRVGDYAAYLRHVQRRFEAAQGESHSARHE